MNTIKTRRTTLTTGLVGALLAGCGPADLPVHAEVEWEGANTGEFEDDSRVQAVREYVVQKHAADNALNYSDPAFMEVTAYSTALRVARAAVGSIESSPIDSVTFWEGPPSFTVTEIEQIQEHEFAVHVVQRLGRRWNRAVGDTVSDGEIQERDGA